MASRGVLKRNGAWYARVTVAGRQITRRCRTEEAAVALAEECRKGIEKAKYLGVEWTPPWIKRPRMIVAKAPRPTLRKFGERFLDEWVSNKRSFRYYKTRVRVLADALGDKRLDAITVADVQAFYSTRRKLRSLATANHDVRVLSVMLNRAVEWDLIEKNPCDRVRTDRPPESGERFLYAEEAEAIHAALRPWARPIYTAALHTGMRKGETLALTWDDVDLKRGELRLRSRTTKGWRERVVPINATLYAVLDDLPRHTTTDRVFVRAAKPVTSDILDNEWTRATAAAGVPAVRWHDLRHTAGSWLVMAGKPIAEVQKILGHTDIRLTLRYAKFAPAHMHSTVAALDTFHGPSRRNPVTKTVTSTPAESAASLSA